MLGAGYGFDVTGKLVVTALRMSTYKKLTDTERTGLLVGIGEGDVGAQDRAQALLQHRVVLEDAVADEALDELRTGEKCQQRIAAIAHCADRSRRQTWLDAYAHRTRRQRTEPQVRSQRVDCTTVCSSMSIARTCAIDELEKKERSTDSMSRKISFSSLSSRVAMMAQTAQMWAAGSRIDGRIRKHVRSCMICKSVKIGQLAK